MLYSLHITSAKLGHEMLRICQSLSLLADFPKNVYFVKIREMVHFRTESSWLDFGLIPKIKRFYTFLKFLFTYAELKWLKVSK